MDQQQIEELEHDSRYNSFDTREVSRPTASHVLAGLFSQGNIPLTPANYLQQIISRIRVQTSINGKFRILTIPQLVTHLNDSGITLSIESIEEISTLIANLEAEIDPTPQTTCGVILHLSQKDKKEERRSRISQFVWNFISSNDRSELVQDVISTGHCPIFVDGSSGSPEYLSLTDEDWQLLLQGAITLICRRESPMAIFDKTHMDWQKCAQTTTVADYIFREMALWSKFIAACGLVRIEAPNVYQRIDRLLTNLSDETRSSLAATLRTNGRRTEQMSYSEIVSILDGIETRTTMEFSWEKPKKRGVNFSPQVQTFSVRDCEHCGKTGVRHTAEQCSRNPKNVVIQRQRSASTDSAKQRDNPPPDYLRRDTPGNTPKASIPVRPPTQQQPETSSVKDEPPHRHRYNLRPRHAQSYAATPPYEEEEYSDSDVDETVSFSVTASINPSHGFVATLDDGTKVTIGFDSFSCLTLIRDGLCPSNDTRTGPPCKLSGIGGSTDISGTTGRLRVHTHGKKFAVHGYVAKTPIGIDILIGTPQMANMKLNLDYSVVPPVAVIGKLQNLRVTLSDLSPRKVLPQSFSVSSMPDLPELEIKLKPFIEAIPFQVREPYSVPRTLKQAADKQIQEEIQLGHLQEVEYDPKMWISPLFIKTKGRTDPETGIVKVRLLADLRQLNANIINPDYWAEQGPNISKFSDSIIPSDDIHFSLIDISNAFHSCPVSPNSRHLLVVRYGNRLLQYNTAPQGLSTSALFWPLHLAAGLNSLIGNHWKSWCEIYVDDILVMGSSYRECKERTEKILACLRKMGKTVSDKSATDPQREIVCIGLHFSSGGVRLSDEGLERLRACLETLPKTTKEMRRLIGGILYASNAFDFTDEPSKFGKLMKPMHAATSLKIFRMNDDIKSSIAELKTRIRNTPRLFANPKTLLDEEHILIITTDASDSGTGGCLFRCKTSVDEAMKDRASALRDSQIIDNDFHSLSDGESRWHTFELESLAVYRALRKWGPLLITASQGHWNTKKILLLTDSQTTLSRWSRPERVAAASAKSKRFAGWALEVSFAKLLPMQFSFIDGDENSLADIFSRISTDLLHPDIASSGVDEASNEVWSTTAADAVSDITIQPEANTEDSRVIQHLPLDESCVSEIASAYRSDDTSKFYRVSLKDIYEELSGETQTHKLISDRVNQIADGRFVLLDHPASHEDSDRLLYTRASYQTEDNRNELCQNFVLVIPEMPPGQPRIASIQPLFRHGVTMREELLILAHDMQGHCGAARTVKFLKCFCWWPSLLQDVQLHITLCEICSRNRKYTKAPGFQVIGRNRFGRIQIDHKDLPDTVKSVSSFCAVLSIIDTVTGLVSFTPVKTLCAAETAFVLVTEWCRRYGIPTIIQSDNSTSFSNLSGQPNDIILEMTRLLGTKVSLTSTYNPQSNGRVERKHRDLNRYLHAFIPYMTDNRAVRLYVALAEAWINQTSDAYLAVFGTLPRTLADAIPAQEGGTPSDATDLLEGNREVFIAKLQEITTENSEWKKLLLDESARHNAALIDARQTRSRLSHIQFNLGDEVLYNNRKYVISSFRYGADRSIPTSAFILDPEDNSETPRKVKYEHLRPASAPAAVPDHPLDRLAPEEGTFIFYESGSDVHGGRVMKSSTDEVFAHMYAPNRDSSIFHPNWWVKEANGDWIVQRLKNKPPGGRPLMHVIPLEEIIAVGIISSTGKISASLKSQLHSRGIFQATGPAPSRPPTVT